VVAFASCLGFFLWLWLIEGKPLGGGLFLVPVLLMVTAPALVRAGRAEPGFDLGGLMATGLALRFAAAYYRFANGFDAHVYNRFGTQLAQSFRALHFDVNTGASVPGTGGMRYLTGLVSVPVGSDEFMKFCVFSWLAWWGCVLLYRAFVTAVPDGDRSRYARLIFLWPSLVFWPSSIGKEAWMLFTLGIAMVGAARVLTRQRGGYTMLLLGLLTGSLVRPNIALLALVAFGVALFLGRREPARAGVIITPAAVAKVAGLVIVLLLGAVLVSKTQQLIDPTDTQAGVSVGSASARVQALTAEGGSKFTPSDPKNPVGYVTAAVTVLFRPFPPEAHGFNELLGATEALFLAGLCMVSWRRLRALPRRLRDEPYYALAVAYLMMFVYAFATVGNFGILARERTQLLPFVFVLLAAPAAARAARRPRPGMRPRRQ